MSPDQRRDIEATIRQDEKMLVRWLTRKLGDHDAARDVAQNVFLRVWAFAERETIENPRALMFKTASNLALNELKRRNRFNRRHVTPTDYADDDPLHNVASSLPSPEKQTTLKEDVSIVMQGIQDLPERARKAFVMNRFDGLSYKQIAVALNVSESSVEKYMIEALRRLRLVVKDARDQEGRVIQFPPDRSGRRSGQ